MYRFYDNQLPIPMSCYIWAWVFPKDRGRVPPKMDIFLHGKTPIKMDDLGEKPLILGETSESGIATHCLVLAPEQAAAQLQDREHGGVPPALGDAPGIWQQVGVCSIESIYP